jgi:predicted nucleic acid-binding protein
LLLVEAASALQRKVAQKQLPPQAASTDFTALLDAVHLGVILLAEDEEIIAAALSLALMLDHRVPDYLYLALAEREGAALATADAGLAAIARQRGVAVLGIGAARS